jgi:hypothetical protein
MFSELAAADRELRLSFLSSCTAVGLNALAAGQQGRETALMPGIGSSQTIAMRVPSIEVYLANWCRDPTT